MLTLKKKIIMVLISAILILGVGLATKCNNDPDASFFIELIKGVIAMIIGFSIGFFAMPITEKIRKKIRKK